MKLLALSDIHGAYEEAMKLIEKGPQVDRVIIAGDLTTFGTPAEAERFVRQAQSYGKPILAVGGNMDPPEIDDRLLALGVSINGRGVVADDVGFFGVSGSQMSLGTPNEISEEEIFRRAERGWNDIDKASWKIFVPHAPPLGTKVDRVAGGKSVGSSAVRRFIELHQPDIVICGHIHEARGTDMLGKAKIINCGPTGRGYYGLITIGSKVVVEARE